MKFRKLIATRITSDIRAALQLAEATVPSPNPRQLLVRMLHVGINASDVNFTAGAYLPGVEPPFDVGLEGIGVVERVGTELADQWSPGQAVGVMAFGAFAEYKLLAPKSVLRLPEATPRMLPLLVSGLTAFLALRHVAELRSGETVVVTGASLLHCPRTVRGPPTHAGARCMQRRRVGRGTLRCSSRSRPGTM